MAQHGIVYPVEFAVIMGSTVKMTGNFAFLVAASKYSSFLSTIVAIGSITSSYFLPYIGQFISFSMDEDIRSPQSAQQVSICFIKWTIERTICLKKLSVGATLMTERTVYGRFAIVGYV